MQLPAGVSRCAPRRHALALAAFMVTACAHGEPLKPEGNGGVEPLAPGTPTRLTYSLDEDQYAGWSRSGSSFFYSYVDALSRQHDRCLGEMPATGGQITRYRCPVNDNNNDSTDAFIEPAPRADGLLAWVEQHNIAGRTVPDYSRIVLGSMNQAAPPRELVRMPYIASSGRAHVTATNLRWASPTTLLYIGADILIKAECSTCKRDTLIIQQDVMMVDTRAGGPPTLVPNSGGTTSIWPDGNGGYYYTLMGYEAVYHRSITVDNSTTVHDFGGLGIARDISVSGNTLSAIVGGNVFAGFDLTVNTLVQTDGGGFVMTVDLTSNESQAYPADLKLFRRSMLSPDARVLVADGVNITDDPPNPNLWLYQVP